MTRVVECVGNNLYRHNYSSWYARYSSGGKRVIKKIGDCNMMTAEQAQQRVAEILDDQRKGLTVAQLSDKYCLTLNSRAKNFRNIIGAVNNHLIPELGGVRISALKTKDIVSFLSGLPSATNRKILLNYLKGMLLMVDGECNAFRVFQLRTKDFT